MDTASITTVVAAAAVSVIVGAWEDVRRERNSETTQRLQSKLAVWN